jgi:hypothetical protein
MDLSPEFTLRLLLATSALVFVLTMLAILIADRNSDEEGSNHKRPKST